MLGELATKGLSAPMVMQNSLESDAVRQARVDLAACFRMAAKLRFHEGVCNHFSLMVPGSTELFLVNPYGVAFEEITASNLLICDFDGNVVGSTGKVESTAFHIHAQLHKLQPRIIAAFHTHMPFATALSMIEGQPLAWAGQTALKFYGRTAVDEDYNGIALNEDEGARIASTIGDADIVFMKNHGVMVVGATVAQAWDDLYYLERAAEQQILAMSTGRPLLPVPHEIAQASYEQLQGGALEYANLHMDAIKRLLAKEQPDFAV